MTTALNWLKKKQPQTDKDVTRREDYVNIEAKVFNKILVDGVKHCIKRIIHHSQRGFIPGLQN